MRGSEDASDAPLDDGRSGEGGMGNELAGFTEGWRPCEKHCEPVGNCHACHLACGFAFCIPFLFFVVFVLGLSRGAQRPLCSDVPCTVCAPHFAAFPSTVPCPCWLPRPPRAAAARPLLQWGPGKRRLCTHDKSRHARHRAEGQKVSDAGGPKHTIASTGGILRRAARAAGVDCDFVKVMGAHMGSWGQRVSALVV